MYATIQLVDEAIALIILFDQIPRNVYRGIDKAYAYDHISLALARSLVPFSADLPLCMRLTLTICLFHSEDLPDHRAGGEDGPRRGAPARPLLRRRRRAARAGNGGEP